MIDEIIELISDIFSTESDSLMKFLLLLVLVIAILLIVANFAFELGIV